MSTYLVAFIVSDFTALSLNDAKYLYRIWVQSDAVTQATYSMSISPGIIEFMENFTGINFQMSKMDQAAIPDFSAGAMENWGLVTYRLVLIIMTYGSHDFQSTEQGYVVFTHPLDNFFPPIKLKHLISAARTEATLKLCTHCLCLLIFKICHFC
jgi:aminopeptidase N